MTVSWPDDFPPHVREMISARDRPTGAGVPWCVVCGEPIRGDLHIHHRLYLGRGGDGRPSNGIAVCAEGQGNGCHITAIHREPKAGYRCGACGWKTAAWRGRCGRCQAWGTVECEAPSATARGWAISQYAPAPGCYRTPLLCAVRGWIVLLDNGRWHPASPAEMAGEWA
jgi:hypothetical protein